LETPVNVVRELRRLGISPKKGLGQHFLVDTSVLERITATAELTGNDVVVEVGPGLGILTRALSGRVSRVIAIELDEELCKALRRDTAGLGNVEVIYGDVLRIEPWQHVGPYTQYKVVANLPYYIGSATITHFLESPHMPSLMVVMLQKEVAQSIASRPGKMSFLSVLVQYYAEAELVFEVPPEAFYPPPKVSSAVLKLKPYQSPPVRVEDTESFLQFVSAGFRQPRKQLLNSLAQGLHVRREKAAAYLVQAGIDVQRRPQTLSIPEWARLWSACRQPQAEQQ